MRFKNKVKKFLIFFFCLLILSAKQVKANDSLLIRQMVKNIYHTQLHHERYFPSGLFPSYRMYYYNSGVLKKDDNSFFTGLIVFTLRTLQPYLDSSSQSICDSIFFHATPVFKKFQNPRGRHQYSFWQTKPVKYFPNSGLLSLFKANAIPDDADCTAICLLALNAGKPIVAQEHDFMQQFTNSRKHKVQSTFADYKKLPVYSTWLSHKVPIDFDVCVLTNILYMVHHYQLPYTTADSASLNFITQVIQKEQYLTDPEYVSPYYNKPSIILYHLSRLMSSAFIPPLNVYRPQLISQARKLYEEVDNFYEKVILSTALLRWGVVPPDDLGKRNESRVLNWKKDFVFFVANMASMLPNPLQRWLTESAIGRFDYYCPAYNDVLFLENLVWKKRRINN